MKWPDLNKLVSVLGGALVPSLKTMKPLLAFLFHLVIAVLVVPMLAMNSGALVYRVVRHIAVSPTSPQRFFSDHLFVLVAATGLWLAYLVSDTFSSRSAVWVCIPALLLLAVRITMWRSTGSVLFHVGVVEHFFTADCQIEAWRDVGFAERCGDKLFLMQVVVGTLGYSIGAAIHNGVSLMHQQPS